MRQVAPEIHAVAVGEPLPPNPVGCFQQALDFSLQHEDELLVMMRNELQAIVGDRVNLDFERLHTFADERVGQGPQAVVIADRGAAGAADELHRLILPAVGLEPSHDAALRGALRRKQVLERHVERSRKREKEVDTKRLLALLDRGQTRRRDRHSRCELAQREAAAVPLCPQALRDRAVIGVGGAAVQGPRRRGGPISTPCPL